MVKNKTRNRNVLIAIIVIVLIILFLNFNNLLSVTNVKTIPPSTQEILDFCNIKTQCISIMQSNGMPLNFLDNLEINCNVGVCTVNEK